VGSQKNSIRLTDSVKLLKQSALRLVATVFAGLFIFPTAQLIVKAQQQEETSLTFRNNVVHILSTFSSGTEEGFGFIAGEQNGQLLIATAKHVVRRQDDSGQWTDADNVRVEFFNDRGQWYSASLKGVYPRSGQDLSILSVAKPSSFVWERRCLGAESNNLRNTRVWFIGRTDTPDPWYIPTQAGSFNDNSFDTSSAANIDITSVRRGTSGAPLISETGILGMIFRDTDGSIATALSVGFIRQFFSENRLNWSLEINEPVDRRLNKVDGPVTQAQDRTIVISGTVVTPAKVLSKGWVVIEHGKIYSVSTFLPNEKNAIWIDTNDIIFPGFIDLHNHPMYAMFEPWDAKQLFNNRYEWRSIEKYRQEISMPARNLQDDPQGFCDIAEFAEVQALTGGTTTFSGMFVPRTMETTFPACLSRLAVRKLEIDSGFYSEPGSERVINVLGITPRDFSDARAEEVLQKVAANGIDLVLIHVAEGNSRDLESTLEFGLLKSRAFLDSHTAVINGVALDQNDFAKMKSAGMALVWSPRSNIALYGSTTDVVTAFKEGVSIALAPDWAPSGSKNMLAEIQYAAQLNKDSLDGYFSNHQLFEMATSIPARIARINDKVGSIKPGLYADLFLLHGDATQPFDSLVQSKAQDVSLVLVNGVPIYGDAPLMSKFNVKTEPVPFCGKTKNLNLEILPNGKLLDVQQRLGQKMKIYNLKLAKVDPCAQ